MTKFHITATFNFQFFDLKLRANSVTQKQPPRLCCFLIIREMLK